VVYGIACLLCLFSHSFITEIPFLIDTALKNITRDVILKFVSENEIGLNCTQQKLCVPIVSRIYRKMLVGIKFTEISVEHNFICDGHHRYLYCARDKKVM